MSKPNWFLLAYDLGVDIHTEEKIIAGGRSVVSFTLTHQGRFVRVPANESTLEGQTAALNEAARKLLTHIYNLSEQ